MTDRVCINLSYAVPNDKAAEVENIFSTHGKWMTEFYSDGTDHLLNAYFTKAPEFKDQLIQVREKQEIHYLL